VSRLRDLWIALGIAAIALIVLLVTSRDFGMVWDEGMTIGRERWLARWVSWLVQPPAGRFRSEMFGDKAFLVFWPFSRWEPDGHPPFYAELGLAGWWVTHWIFSPLTAYRFGPMALVAATCGVLYRHLAQRRGPLAGAAAAGALLLMPHSFAHAHYAHYDMPLSALWLLAMIAFSNGLQSRRWGVAFGVFLGLAAGTKFTGWLAPAAPLAWVAWHESPAFFRWLRGRAKPSPGGLAGVRTLLIGLPVAALTVYAVQPPWWAHPWRGVGLFLRSNLMRAKSQPIASLYLGHVYPFSLPWHNTFVLTAVSIPVLMLVLATMGLAAGIARRRTDPEATLWPLAWGVLMVVRALPNAPGHDGIRLILPSIACLAALAGLGAAWLTDLLRPVRLAWLAPVLAAGALLESVVETTRLYPYTLSYYNFAAGGLPGAEALGFEPTYYWDTMGPEFLDWAAERGREGPVDFKYPEALVNVFLLREWGKLPPEPVGPDSVRSYYVLQRRKGRYTSFDSWLERNARPVFTISREGVDLLRVYPYAESRRAYEAARGSSIPRVR
jgi:4-amino-4-deoxy-L-arabinose transferase-like glycosyltransferase